MLTHRTTTKPCFKTLFSQLVFDRNLSHKNDKTTKFNLMSSSEVIYLSTNSMKG